MHKKGESGELFVANDGKYVLRAKAKQFPRKTVLSLLLRAWHRQGASITYFWDKEQAELIARVKDIYGDLPMSTSISEALQVYTAVHSTSKIPGSLAEVGVYKAGTARIIATARQEVKPLHLFDTFGDGLPEPNQHDDSNWKAGSFKITEVEFEVIKKFFTNIPNVYFHKGLFPSDTGVDVENERFSFINLDVDIYESTKDCLEFFYPRLNKGGIILSHDYRGSLGVKDAFDEFFANKPEPIIALSTSQCLVVKI